MNKNILTNGKMNELTINLVGTEELRKPAFAFFNRDVVESHVELIFTKMKESGFRESALVQVVPAERAIDWNIRRLIDSEGNPILEEDFSQYYLVIDGQHRTKAVKKYNEWLKSRGEGEGPINVPAILAALRDGEPITKYLNEINTTLKEWNTEDYLNGAANINPDILLLQRFKQLIKKPSNQANGISLSTLNLIFCGNSGGLTKLDLVLLCYGHQKKGKKERPIIPSYDIETGDKFLELCKKATLRSNEIAKRYLITEFNNLKNEKDKAFALKVFDMLTQEDVTLMQNEYSHLDEKKVSEVMRDVKKRYQDSLEKVEENEAA